MENLWICNHFHFPCNPDQQVSESPIQFQHNICEITELHFQLENRTPKSTGIGADQGRCVCEAGGQGRRVHSDHTDPVQDLQWLPAHVHKAQAQRERLAGSEKGQGRGRRHLPYSNCSPPPGRCCRRALRSRGHSDPPEWAFGVCSTGRLLGRNIPPA